MEENKKPDNPTVFPEMTEKGITLRDYFAAKAMQAIISAKLHEEGFTIGKTGKDTAKVANASYGVADAMLKARENQ